MVRFPQPLPHDFRSLFHLELKPSVEPVHPSVAVYVQRSVKLRHYPPFCIVAEERKERAKRQANTARSKIGRR